MMHVDLLVVFINNENRDRARGRSRRTCYRARGRCTNDAMVGQPTLYTIRAGSARLLTGHTNRPAYSHFSKQ